VGDPVAKNRLIAFHPKPVLTMLTRGRLPL
jgi:hypothetical protein